MSKFLGICMVWLVFTGLMLGLGFGLHRTHDAQVPIRSEIEKAIQVKDLENKFVVMRYVGFGGAGAGGLGAPMVIAYYAQQFSDLVPENENIYVAFSQSEDSRVLKKVYWAFIENRAGLMVYEDVYQYNYYKVEKYTAETVYFHYDNLNSYLSVLLILFGMIGVVIAFVVSLSISGA